MKSIDINCDMGESYGNFHVGNDQAIFPFITSCNVACGFHAGDPVHMERTIRLAISHGVQVGAHPGFPDLAGFGRRNIEMSSVALKANIKYQLAAIKGMAESLGTSVRYVKPHGALYNMAANNEAVSRTIMGAVEEIDAKLVIMGLAGSLFQKICMEEGVRFVAEAFADRAYEQDGTLRSRQHSNAQISDPQVAARQVIEIVTKQQVTTHDGVTIGMEAESICVHGDNPDAVDILTAVDSSLHQAGIEKKSFL